MPDDLGVELARKNDLPRFHPDEHEDQRDSFNRKSLIGESAPAHVRPEKENRQNERRRPQIIA